MIKGFDPLVFEEPQILILGSLPSVKSLAKGEYYGHHQNRFWKILSVLYEMPIETYEMKKHILEVSHIALWDSIGEAEREGSLDSAIKNAVPNDIEGLLKKYPSIKKICCTGGLSYTLCTRYFGHLPIEIVKLPSPSPANAAMKLEELVEVYRKALSI